MDFNAINLFIDQAFFGSNNPTYIDVNQIIEYYTTYIITPYDLSISQENLKDLSSKILKILEKVECNELYALIELVFAGLIIHRGRLDDRDTFNKIYRQWIWSRWLLAKLNEKVPIVAYDKHLLLNPNDIEGSMTHEMQELYKTRYLFVPLWNMSTADILEVRSNFEKTLITTSKTIHNNSLLLPYNSLPFWYTQPAFGLTYHSSNNSTLLGLLGQFYKGLLELSFPSIPVQVTQQRSQQSTKKIGFIARTFNNHAVCRISLGLIEKLSAYADIDLYIYTIDITNNQNQFSKRILAAAKTVRIIHPSQFTETVTQIRNDSIDTLVVIDSFMDIYTYCVGLYRCAPLQLTTWGHPDTSGSPNIDNYISSRYFEKQVDNIYYEKPYIMNSLSFYYYDLKNTFNFDAIEMFKDVPQDALRKELGISTNGTETPHIYGIISSMFKFHPSFDCIINAILHYDKNAYILLIRGVHEDLYLRVIDRLNRTILDDNKPRIITVPYQTIPFSYEKLLLSCDVILDTSPFGGCISTYDAFNCNKCVLTLPGNKLYGRFTQGLYKFMEDKNNSQGTFTDLIAKNEDNYVELALKIAAYPAFRRTLEKKIAEMKHVLYENQEAVDEWYALIKSH